MSLWASLKIFWSALGLALFDQTLEYFLEVKLTRVDIFKICFSSTMDSMVTIHFNYQLKKYV